MNKDEYYILIDIADQLGKDDPKGFIDKRIEGNSIFGKTIICNDNGNIISVVLSGTGLKGSIPSSIGKLVHLKVLNLNDNKLSGSIPLSIGSLVHLNELRLSRNKISGSIPLSIGDLVNLKELHLTNNELSGSIPQSIGKLAHLKHLNLNGNKQLTGALPSMVSKDCSIDINDTNISRVEIKTKPLRYWYDHIFMVSHIVLGYIDLIMDVLAIIALSSKDIPIMIANILFILLGILLRVWMSGCDTISIIRIIFQVDMFYQGYKSIVDKQQTHELVVAKKLDAITRSMPSMILQLYGLLKAESSNSSFLTLLLVSIGSSIIGAACTLASLAPKSGSSIFSGNFIVHYTYYVVELLLRVTNLGIMFFTVKEFGFIVAGIDFMIRVFLGYSESEENVRDALIMAIQSFGSDRTVPGRNNKILKVGFMINTVEMFIFLIILYTIKTGDVVFARSNGYVTTLTAIICVTWLIRVIFMWSGILDRVRTPTETIISKEGMVINDDPNTV